MAEGEVSIETRVDIVSFEAAAVSGKRDAGRWALCD